MMKSLCIERLFIEPGAYRGGELSRVRIIAGNLQLEEFFMRVGLVRRVVRSSRRGVGVSRRGTIVGRACSCDA